MHVIIIIHKTSSVKIGLNTKLTPSCSNFLHLIYDTKVFQILYSTYYKLRRGPSFFIFLLSQVFNLLSCVYIRVLVIFKLHFGRNIFSVYFTMHSPHGKFVQVFSKSNEIHSELGHINVLH
jgi:hypothetical protein